MTFGATCTEQQLQRTLSGWGQLRGSQLAAGAARATGVAMPWLPSIAALSPVTPTTVTGCKTVPYGLLFVMVPSIGDENARIVGTFFHAK